MRNKATEKKKRQRQGRPRNQKNYKLTFMLSPEQLAQGLTAIQALEINYHPASLNQMVKMMTLDWMVKYSFGGLTVSQSAKQEIATLMSRTRAGQKVMLARRVNDPELSLIVAEKQAKRKQALVIPTQEEASEKMAELFQAAKGTPEKELSEKETVWKERYDAEEKYFDTGSSKTVVTDFSPPSMEELMNLEEE